MKKSLNIDIIFPWEVGLILFIIGFLVIVIGIRQSKRQFDFDEYPFIKPTTKMIFGTFVLIFGAIQMLPLLKM